MHKIVRILFMSTALFVTQSCSDKSPLAEKKAQLEKLKDQQNGINGQVDKLEKEIAKLDTTIQEKGKLVSLETIAPINFSHYIELQGKVDAENISYISPRGQGGQVREVLVKKGDNVRKGQLLLKLDNIIQNQQVVAARQGLETIKSQIGFAKDIAQRQQNLWDQKIGTEVQLITAKNNVNNLQTQLVAAQENVKTGQELLNTFLVYSDVAGVANTVNIRVGEIFTPGSQAIQIVNNSLLKATTTIPENYLASVKKGTDVVVQVTDINKTYNTNISFIAAAIDPLSRGFIMDAKLPNDGSLKPNQTALIKIRDYNADGAITIPVNTLQSDEKGKFVMVAVNKNGKWRAEKRQIIPGQFYGDRLEVKSGIGANDKIISEGFQSVYDGQLLSLK